MRNAKTIVTRPVAEQLAARIAAYWALAGHPQVRAWVVPVSLGRDVVWEVRSNLVRGVPPS